MLYDHLPKFIRDKIAGTWIKELLLKLYLKLPAKLQYMIAKYTMKKAALKKKEEIIEFMRQ